MVALEELENAQFHVTYLALQLTQFHHFPNNVSLPVYDETKLQCPNSSWTHRNLNAHLISATMQVFLCDCRKGNILLQME
jgi:hypothetical protein